MGVPVTAIGGEMVVGFNRPRLQSIVERLQKERRPVTLGAAVKDVPGGGVLASMVHPGTPAERGGLKPGDIIVEVDGAPVAGADTLVRLLQVAKERGNATMRVLRAGSSLELRIPLAAA